jgi:hypothetical protein
MRTKRATVEIDLSNAVSLPGHDQECLCVGCMMADLNNHILTTRGEDALARIDLATKTDKASVKPERTRNLSAGQRVGRGYVRTISSKQVWLINKLISERDTSGITLLPGQTLNPTEIPTMGVKGGSALIEKLFKCPEKPKAFTPNNSVKKEIKGSDKQIAWITGKLLSDKGFTKESDINALYTRCDYRASNIISELLAMPTVKKETVVKSNKESTTKTVEITEGMYKLSDRIFKVYMNRAETCLLVKELIDGEFEYMGSAQWKLPKAATRMTLDEAKAYGALTGTCCVCSRKLTDEGSIKAGIGPVCESKF